MEKKWQIQTLYFYLVSFVALILIITGSVRLSHTAIAYLTPLPEAQRSIDSYPVPVPRKADTSYSSDPDSTKLWEERFGPALIEQEKERSEAITRGNNRRSLLRNIIGSIAYIIIALPVYLYHWRKIPQLEEA